MRAEIASYVKAPMGAYLGHYGTYKHRAAYPWPTVCDPMPCAYALGNIEFLFEGMEYDSNTNLIILSSRVTLDLVFGLLQSMEHFYKDTPLKGSKTSIVVHRSIVLKKYP